MFTTPAVDASRARRAGHYGVRRRRRVRGLPEFAGELPVSALAEEIETPGDGRIRALVTVAGNPVLSTPDGAPARPRARRAGLHGRRSTSTSTRPPGTRTSSCRRPSPLERDHYDLVFHPLAVRNTARCNPAVLPRSRRRAARLGDLPRIGYPLCPQDCPRWWIATPTSGSGDEPGHAAAHPDPGRRRPIANGRNRVSLRKLKRSPHGVDLGPLQPSLPGAVGHQDQADRPDPEAARR